MFSRGIFKEVWAADKKTARRCRNPGFPFVVATAAPLNAITGDSP
jgi:hypothetical protein